MNFIDKPASKKELISFAVAILILLLVALPPINYLAIMVLLLIDGFLVIVYYFASRPLSVEKRLSAIDEWLDKYCGHCIRGYAEPYVCPYAPTGKDIGNLKKCFVRKLTKK